MMSGLRNALFAAAALAVVPGPAQSQGSPISMADRSVVRVLNLDGKQGVLYIAGMGSGVLIDGNGHILTNEHVVEGSDEVYVQWKQGSGTGRDVRAKVVRRDKSIDLALLKVDGIDATPIPFASGIPEKGSAVYAVGFPGAADLSLQDPFGDAHKRYVEATVTQGIVSRLLSRELPDRPDIPLVQHSAVTSGGSSGGALLNTCGELIGISSMTGVDSSAQGDIVKVSGFSFAIQGPTVTDFARRGGATPVIADLQCAATGNPSTLPPSGVAPASPNSTEMRERAELGLIAVALAAFLALVGVVAWFVSSRRQEASPASRNADPLARPSPRAWELLGRTESGGVVRGVVIEGRHDAQRPLIIGREANSGLVIDDPAISRRHAKLYAESGRLWCVDLGSVNGTTLNGQPLDQSPTPVGDRGRLLLGTVTLAVLVSDSRRS
jgi:S1-C subfamily serine protease